VVALASALALPVALGGESVSESGGSGTLLAIIAAASMLVGYVVLYLLWRYVFSAKARDKRGEPPEY
jgi:hypothetical protein